MSIYKRSIVFSLLVTLLALGISYCLVGNQNGYCSWCQDICIGVLASGFLLIGTSIIGYQREKKKLFAEYHWKLSELKHYSLELQTIPDGDVEAYYEKYKQINILLKNYFAMLEIAFFCSKSKKAQKLIEINNKLYPLVGVTNKALVKYREFICGKRRNNGERIYSEKSFLNDIRDVEKVLNNYDNSGMILAIWVEQKEKEYGKTVYNYKENRETPSSSI